MKCTLVNLREETMDSGGSSASLKWVVFVT